MTWKDRYIASHKQWFAKEYPSAFRDGHYTPPNYPKILTSNGMTTAICNFINWEGYRAKRINNTGRLIDKETKTESGLIFKDKKFIKSASGKGMADISSTIFGGRSAQWEIKAGKDKPSPFQLKEQEKERRAGGIYEFIYSIELFFEIWDKLKKDFGLIQGDLF